jgi:large subunit ribosomal protein L1
VEEIREVINLKQEFKPKEAIERMKEISKERKFNESIEVIFRMSVDPKQGDQNIRGTCVLPAGTGTNIKVLVFADKDMEAEVMAAGADFFGNDEMLKQIAEGIINFDKLIATPEQMAQLKPLAKIIGPKGLMPNLKSNTLVKPDVLLEAVRLSKQGQIEFRINDNADIMAKIGLRSFTNEDIAKNYDSLARALIKKKPETIKGNHQFHFQSMFTIGRYFVRGYLKTTMGTPIKIDLSDY